MEQRRNETVSVEFQMQSNNVSEFVSWLYLGVEILVFIFIKYISFN